MTSDEHYWADALALFLLDYSEDRIDYPALRIVAEELGMCVSVEDANLWAETHQEAQRTLNNPGETAWDYDWAQDKAAELDAECAEIAQRIASRRVTGFRLNIFDRAWSA
jgi:hypothetical protein